jgi:hypothetical protein
MNDSADPLEAELSVLTPCEPSPGLRRRVAAQLSEPHRARSRLRGVTGLTAGLAAACMAAALLWWSAVQQVAPEPIVGPEIGQGVEMTIAPRETKNSIGIVACRDVRRILAGAEMAAFAWPLEETSPPRVSGPIPPDLLD